MNFFSDIRTISLAFFAALLLIACGSPKMDEEVEKTGEDCPIQVGREGTVTHITQNDTAVVFAMTVDEDSVSLDSAFLQPAHVEGLIARLLRAKKNKPDRLIAAMTEQHKGLQFLFTGSKSGQNAQAYVSGARLNVIIDEKGRFIPDADRRARLAATDTLTQKVKTANKRLPAMLREGLQLDSVAIEGGYLLFRFTLNGMGLSIDKVKNNSEAVKDEVLRLLPTLGELKPICKQAHLGLILRFKTPKPTKKNAPPQRTCGILVTPDEFAKLKN